MGQEYIGIDFGTTNTAVVCVQNDELGRRIRPIDENDYPFSSMVAIPKEGNELLFGREVRKIRTKLSETHHIYTSMKPHLGTDYEFVVGEQKCTAVHITAEYLKYIKNSVMSTDGINITKASFSFPIDFSPEARRDLRRAAEMAGIEVASFVTESTGTYLANRDKCKVFSNVMVLDWGGGTFDISVLKLHHTEVHEKALSGCGIGGDYIDKLLAKSIHSRIASKRDIEPALDFFSMPTSAQDNILSKCEEAKIAMSDYDYDEEYPFTIQNYGVYGTNTEMLKPEQFDLNVKVIAEKHILPTIENALIEANLLSVDLIDAVIVVGGSSNLLMYERVIMNLFKNSEVIFPEKRQWSAATGAALMQIIGGNYKLENSLGVLLSDGKVFPLLEKNNYLIGDDINPVTFSLTDDSQDARFIFTDESGKNVLETMSVPTKGYYNEKLSLSASLDYEQIIKIEISNTSMGEKAIKKCEITGLPFVYDVKALDETPEISSI